MAYLVVIERAGRNYSAYVPDLPGCVATGRTPGAATKAIGEAIEFHLDGLRADGMPVPKPTARSAKVSAGRAAKTNRSRRSAA